MEPGGVPAGSVPPGKRYRIAGDGTAVNLRSSQPADTCRISHFDVCGAKQRPTGSVVLERRWVRNRQLLR